MTNFPNGVSSYGIPMIGGGVPTNVGRYLFVTGSNGSDGNRGITLGRGFATIQKAVDSANAGTTILVAPGAYDETVTISRTAAHSGLTIMGLGGRGAAYIEPSTEDAGGMVVHADDVRLVNLGVAGEDATSAVALTVTGSRFRAYECKFEGGAKQLVLGPGTVAQEEAGTHGNAGDALFSDCEFCWGTDGIHLTCTDYGAVTQGRFERCRFHNLSGKHITETVGSGGSAAVTFQNITVHQCTFDDLDDGTAPTNYIDLNGNNANTGVVSCSVFPTAINSGLNLVSTAMHWVSNFHTGGISTGQPS
jgi:hypothetical protein